MCLVVAELLCEMMLVLHQFIDLLQQLITSILQLRDLMTKLVVVMVELIKPL